MEPRKIVAARAVTAHYMARQRDWATHLQLELAEEIKEKLWELVANQQAPYSLAFRVDLRSWPSDDPLSRVRHYAIELAWLPVTHRQVTLLNPADPWLVRAAWWIVHKLWKVKRAFRSNR